ncbi:hypothetical protein TWF706_002341 [Orbilia oligospora]|nr:hypothetical protein TWF706_002341 [Orbilia oligospora]
MFRIDEWSKQICVQFGFKDEKSLTRVFHDLIKRGAISCFEYRRLDGALAIPPLGVGNATYGAILKLSSSRSARTSHLFNRPRDNKRYVLSVNENNQDAH